jgi:hypothetical protein
MPFRKGRSGNPGGRPKETPFADALRMEIKAAGKDHKALRNVARALIDKAATGDIPAIRELADRLDGKAIQAVDTTLSSTDGAPITRVELVAAQPDPSKTGPKAA